MSSKALVRSAVKVERELQAALGAGGAALLYQWARRYGQWLVDVAKGQLPSSEVELEARLLTIEERLGALEEPRSDKSVEEK